MINLRQSTKKQFGANVFLFVLKAVVANMELYICKNWVPAYSRLFYKSSRLMQFL